MDATARIDVGRLLNVKDLSVTLSWEEWHRLMAPAEPGKPCPACKRKVPMTNAQRQAAWRGRKS